MMKQIENEMNFNVPLEIIKASEIEPKEVKWLWYPYIPFGKVTLLQGDPDDGKSKLMLSIAALLSEGQSFPFTDAEENEPVILFWYEQKTLCILLTLLYLEIKNVRLFPVLPTFVSPNVPNCLIENFGIAPVTTPEKDLKQFLKQHRCSGHMRTNSTRSSSRLLPVAKRPTTVATEGNSPCFASPPLTKTSFRYTIYKNRFGSGACRIRGKFGANPAQSPFP